MSADRRSFPALNGLRGIAALLVITGHFANNLGYGGSVFTKGTGQVGVMLFFVLSGFLMGWLYIDRSLNRNEITAYAVRRFARVVPLYLFVVTAAYVSFLFGTPRFDINNQNILAHIFFIHGESVLWTVAVEIQFYFLFPIIWWLHSRRLAVIGVMLTILALSYNGFAHRIDLLSTGHFFLTGILVSIYTKAIDRQPSWMFPVAMLILVFLLPSVLQFFGIKFSLWKSAAYVIGIPIVLLACVKNDLADAILGSKIPAFFGQISYSAYLLHMPVIWYFGGLIRKVSYGPVMIVVFLAIVTVVAYASYRLIELPAQAWIRRSAEVQRKNSRSQV